MKAYVKDSAKRNSSTVTLKVVDVVPPTTPKVNNITNKSFLITGTTEAKAKVTIKKNKKLFKTLTADSKGKFSYRIPLQSAKTNFEFYATDATKNNSATKRIIVANKAKPASFLACC